MDNFFCLSTDLYLQTSSSTSQVIGGLNFVQPPPDLLIRPQPSQTPAYLIVGSHITREHHMPPKPHWESVVQASPKPRFDPLSDARSFFTFDELMAEHSEPERADRADPIQAALHRVADPWRLSNIRAFGSREAFVQTEPTEYYMQIYRGFRGTPAPTIGTYDHVGLDGIARRLAVVLRSEKPVIIAIDGHACSKGIIEYLESLDYAVDHEKPSPETRTERQAHWYQHNGKCFKFLQLPAEVRNKIYAEYFGPRIEIRLISRDPPCVQSRAVHTNILRVGRQVFEEATAVLYRESTFNFTSSTSLRLSRSQMHAAFNQIARLELAFPSLSFMDFFGYNFRDDSDGNYMYGSTSYTARQIREMRLLRLTLDLQWPGDAMYHQGGYRTQCHQVWTDYLLDCARPWIKGHPVRIIGYIKPQRKKEFEAEMRTFQVPREQSPSQVYSAPFCLVSRRFVDMSPVCKHVPNCEEVDSWTRIK